MVRVAGECADGFVGASTDPRAARRDAAAQVGFYSTPKGYDALFP